MKNEQDFVNDIRQIRNIMERTTRFISLSGLSGILAGIYALAGSYIAWRLIYDNEAVRTGPVESAPGSHLVLQLALLAVMVLVLTLVTGIWMSFKKSKREHQLFWGPGSKQFLLASITPLVTGGLLVILLSVRAYYAMIVPSFLIFYGIALIQGGKHSVSDVQWLGYIEIMLGLICVLVPGYGLLFWALGFGLLHIIYGTIMSLKYGM